MQQHDIAAILVTRGAQGMTLFQKDKAPVSQMTYAREVFDVTGAGDTVIAVIAVSLALGESMPAAMKLANLAAGIVVGRSGAATVSAAELRRASRKASGLNLAVLTQEQAQLIASDARAQSERIVMTNGCFDILHAGHVLYLKQAKALGDRLLVAVNDDDSVRRLKGSTRPINPLARRMSVLAGLDAVDWVVPFSEDTPEQIIQKISPDVLVKGGDYTIENIAGADYVLQRGGDVKVLDFEQDCSTSAVIARLEKEI